MKVGPVLRTLSAVAGVVFLGVAARCGRAQHRRPPGRVDPVVLEAVSWPALRGYGRVASNPTYLPRDYRTGLAVSLAAVWAGCAVWALSRVVRSRPSG